jgi:hypothetical protein
MNQPTDAMIAAALQLDIDPSFGQAPINILRLAEIVADLQRRIEVLEGAQNGGNGKRWGRK